MDVDRARESGAMALFGEKYGERVRVVSVGDFSVELCGGTHVDNVAEIGPFFITLETGIASGIRRLEAITGHSAIEYMLDAKEFRSRVAALIGRSESDALEGVQQLRETNAELQKEIKRAKAEMFSGGGRAIGSEEKVGALHLVTHNFDATDRDIMASWIDSQKDRSDPIVAVALGQVNGKQVYVAAASQAAVSSLHINVGTLSKAVLPRFGGRGGGKPNFAQGSVAADAGAEAVFAAIRESLARSEGQP
jgi:alanyl-tRNA synthetase